MNTWQDYAVALTKIDSLKMVRDEFLEEWGEDTMATLLFGNFGSSIVEHYDDFPPMDREYIFTTIEAAMNTTDQTTKDVVATGLLEALFNRGSRDADRWKRIEQDLGDKSKRYLIAWGNWANQIK